MKERYKRAQTNIIASVLIILIVIVAVAVVFGIVKNVVSGKSEGIGVGFKSYLQQLAMKNCGDGVCNSTEGESCENCLIDCGLCGEEKGAGAVAVGILTSCQDLTDPGNYILEADIIEDSLSGTGSCIYIKSENITLDCQENSIIIRSRLSGVFSDKDYTTIRNCKFYFSTTSGRGGVPVGITLLGADNSIIEGNTIEGGVTGISISGSSDVVLEDNFIKNIDRDYQFMESYGFYFTDSHNIILNNNSACGKKIGLECSAGINERYPTNPSTNFQGTGNTFTNVSSSCGNDWPVLGDDYSECVGFNRQITNNCDGTYTVTLNSGATNQNLGKNEIIIVVDKLPEGASVVPDSWNYEPRYSSDLGNILAWLFSSNPLQYESLPSQITYQITGSSGEIKGKWGLNLENIDGDIIGDEILGGGC